MTKSHISTILLQLSQQLASLEKAFDSNPSAVKPAMKKSVKRLKMMSERLCQLRDSDHTTRMYSIPMNLYYRLLQLLLTIVITTLIITVTVTEVIVFSDFHLIAFTKSLYVFTVLSLIM